MPLRRRATLVVLIMLAADVRGAMADEATPLTLEGALELARARAPEIGAARLRVDEAQGRLESASVLLRANPSLAVGLGPRVMGPSGLAADVEVSQTFELGGRRSARIDGARAGVDRAIAAGEDSSRRILRETGLAFLRALHAQERLKLATRAEDLAGAIVRIAERRHQAGDVPVLHVNVARGALARARSERRATEATLAAGLGELRILLGVEPGAPLVLQGDLSDRGRFERTAAGHERRGERPDLQVVAAEVREAGADQRLGEGLGWPELGVGLKYMQEGAGASSVLGTLTLTLPIFERGQGARAEARARERRGRFELDAAHRRASVEVDTALTVYRTRVASVAELEATAPVQVESEALARRSYEMGELGLADLLLVRREVLETQVDFLGRQLDAATAGIELEAATGALK